MSMRTSKPTSNHWRRRLYWLAGIVLLVSALLFARWWHRHRPAGVPSQPWVSCAVGQGPFETACTGDLDYRPDGIYLTLYQPDGGFHRLLVAKDGRGVIAADGAEPAKVTPLNQDTIEVAIANMRYRLPAKVASPSTGGKADPAQAGGTGDNSDQPAQAGDGK